MDDAPVEEPAVVATPSTAERIKAAILMIVQAHQDNAYLSPDQITQITGHLDAEATDHESRIAAIEAKVATLEATVANFIPLETDEAAEAAQNTRIDALETEIENVKTSLAGLAQVDLGVENVAENLEQEAAAETAAKPAKSAGK